MTIAAFVLSIIALVTNAWFTWLRWPRIAVEVSKRVRMSATVSETVTLTDYAAVVVGRDEPSAAPPATDPAPPQQGFRGTTKLEGDQHIPAGTASGTYTWAGSATGHHTDHCVDRHKQRFRRDNDQDHRIQGGRSAAKHTPSRLPSKPGVVRGRRHSRPQVSSYPDRIEGHDCRIYEYSEDALKTLPAGEYRGYAQRYKSFRIWPKCNRPTVRESTSKDTIKRQPP